jgi:hypothetical protein
MVISAVAQRERVINNPYLVVIVPSGLVSARPDLLSSAENMKTVKDLGLAAQSRRRRRQA